MPKALAGIALAGTLATGGTLAADRSIDPYTTIGSTLQIEASSTLPEAGTDATIVDTTQPKITLSKWGGKVQMGVTYTGIQSQGGRPLLSKNVTWTQDPTQSMEAVPIDATTTMEDGGMEINIKLPAEPTSNVFNFAISGAEELDFFYQPALTQKEIDAGDQRPENVIGSYAVYYKDHVNHIEGQTNYGTGKAYHIFRPLVTDAKGNTVWADMSYGNAVLTVTVPQDFLDTATYPVKVDPTFGYTSQGASNTQIATDSTHNANTAQKGTAITGTQTSISAYLKTGSGTDNNNATEFSDMTDASGVPSGSLTACDDFATISITTAYTLFTWGSAFETCSLTGANYWVMIIGTFVSTTIFIATDTGGPAGTGAIQINGGAWSSNTNLYSVYATYTAPAAATPHSTIKIQKGTVTIPKGRVVMP